MHQNRRAKSPPPDSDHIVESFGRFLKKRGVDDGRRLSFQPENEYSLNEMQSLRDEGENGRDVWQKHAII